MRIRHRDDTPGSDTRTGMPVNRVRRYLGPAVVILCGIVLSLAAFRAVRERDRRLLELEFQREAENHYAAFARGVELNLQTIDSLQAFHEHAAVRREEFRAFVTPLLRQHRSIQALEWIPRVADRAREAEERRARQEGFPAFRFSERLTQGKMTRAARRREYFPAYYVEPYKGNEIALGFDLASNPVRREALERARDTGEMLATARITLVQEREKQAGFLVFAPVYRGEAPTSVAKRREDLAGFALGVFRVGDILEKSLTYLKPAGIDIALYDRSAPAEESFLYHHSSRMRSASDASSPQAADERGEPLSYARTLNVASRQWLVVCRAAPGFYANKQSTGPLMVLVGGLTITLLLAGYLLGNIRRSDEVHRLNEELERKVAERTEQLVAAQDELVRKEKLAILGQLSGSVGHELRNPLGVMSNAVYFLQMVLGDADESVREYLELIRKEIGTSQRIITDLLDFARTRTPQQMPVAVHDLVSQNLAKCDAPENVTVRLGLPETLPAVVVDPLQMGQVLQNLITNAVQAMPDGGALRVAARPVQGSTFKVPCPEEETAERRTSNMEPDADFVAISVEDTGQGITPENLKRLFHPLFTTKARGVGLGLTVCRSLTEANGGRIEVESRIGEGTTFTVILPVSKEGEAWENN